MNVTSKISVDMTRQNVGQRINAVQGDGNTRLVEITLLAGGKPWEPPEGVEAAIAYMQPGGTKGLYNKLADGTAAISMAGNVATIILAPQMLVASGTVQASLVFNDAALNRLTTFPFAVSVTSNPAAGAQKVEDYLRLQWLEDKLEEYLEAIKASGVFDGKPGDNGVTFTPSVSENGDLSWRNNGGLPNPKTVNIRGPQGDSTAATAAANAAQTSAANAKANAVNAAASAAAAQAAADAAGTELSHIKDDLSAEQTARENAVNAMRADLTANTEVDADTRRKLDCLWKLNQGISYQFETDDTESYQKTVPTGAKMASVEQICGKTMVWNQHIKLAPKSWNGVEITVNDDGSITISGAFLNENWEYDVGINIGMQIPKGHKIYAKLSPPTAGNTTYAYRFIGLNYAGIHIADYGTGILTTAANGVYRASLCVFSGGVGIEINESYRPYLVDLTAIFGPGNEPTSTDDPRITWIEKYVAEHPGHNTGELVSAEVERIKYNHTVIADIPNDVRTLPGFGWSAGNVCNAIERTDAGWQYLQRVGSVDLGSLSWIKYFDSDSTFYADVPEKKKNSNDITSSIYTVDKSGNVPAKVQDKHISGYYAGDKVWIQDTDYTNAADFTEHVSGRTLYFELQQPIVSDISDLTIEKFEVEAGGTLTFENAAKLPVQNSVEYLISLAEVNQ